MMQLQMVLRTCQQQLQLIELEIHGGVTGGSIFRHTENLLQESEDCRLALAYIAARKNAERYQSMMDFFFCELHPYWRAACFAWYNDRGKQLREIITPMQALVYDTRLMLALDYAVELFKSKKRTNWRKFSVMVEQSPSYPPMLAEHLAR